MSGCLAARGGIGRLSTDIGTAELLDRVHRWADAELELRNAMKGATLLLTNSSLVAATGWSELDALRRLGAARVVLPHPYGGNGAVVTIALRRPTVSRASKNLLGLLRLAFGRLMFVQAKPEQGKMWIAGPLSDIAAHRRRCIGPFRVV